MRIYIVTDNIYPSVGGMEKVVEYSAKELAKNNDVVVFSPNLPGWVDHFPFKIVRVKSIPIIKPTSLFPLPRLDHNLKKFLQNMPKPDIIHIHGVQGLAKWFAKYGEKNNIPTFLTLHAFMKHIAESGMPVKFLRPALEKSFLKIVSMVPNLLTISEGCKKYYEELGYKNIQIVRNGNDALEKNDNYCLELRKKYKLSEKDNVMCYVNRLVSIKNIFLLCDALKILKTRNFQFKMLIAGDGADKKKMEEVIRNYNLENQVFFLGNLKDREKVASVYYISDLHLFPSVKDGAGLSQGEAGSQNTPTLGIENCPATELIQDNINGFLSKNDPQSYAEKIIEIFKDRNNLQIVGKKAKDTLFISWHKHIEQLTEIYENKLGKRK